MKIVVRELREIIAIDGKQLQKQKDSIMNP